MDKEKERGKTCDAVKLSVKEIAKSLQERFMRDVEPGVHRREDRRRKSQEKDFFVGLTPF